MHISFKKREKTTDLRSIASIISINGPRQEPKNIPKRHLSEKSF